MAARPLRTIVRVVMDVLFVLAVLDVARVCVEFFGVLKVQQWAKAVIRITEHLVLPLGLKGIATPYGGVFDVTAAVTVLLLLAIEWGLGVARHSA